MNYPIKSPANALSLLGVLTFHCWLVLSPWKAFGQGEILLGNIDNTSTDPYATANGLFWIGSAGSLSLINQDFNASFYAGTDSSSLSLLATFLLSDATAVGGNSRWGPGFFLDPSERNRNFASSTFVYVSIQAWTGNFNSYAAARSGGALTAQSPIFATPVDIPPGPPATLTGMPAMILSTVPEPSAYALLAVGSSLFLIFYRREKRGR